MCFVIHPGVHGFTSINLCFVIHPGVKFRPVCSSTFQVPADDFNFPYGTAGYSSTIRYGRKIERPKPQRRARRRSEWAARVAAALATRTPFIDNLFIDKAKLTVN